MAYFQTQKRQIIEHSDNLDKIVLQLLTIKHMVQGDSATDKHLQNTIETARKCLKTANDNMYEAVKQLRSIEDDIC